MPTAKSISHGTAHKLTPDIRSALLSDKQALAAWEDLTPLARNEWICWVTFVKKEETRHEHLVRLIQELKEGVRRPCCWIGCIHRTDKAVSPSVRGILARGKTAAAREVTCSRGHTFMKSKDVPTCPVCWPGRYKKNT